LPDSVAALVSEMTDTETVATLVNLEKSSPRTVTIQGGAYGEHRILSAQIGGRVFPIDSPSFTIQLAPGAGARITVRLRHYPEQPTESSPHGVM
jgi:hypothetical protein